jgi:glyoxylase-like metal-dependent hydrolase (beta-lactamase superfamily II)
MWEVKVKIIKNGTCTVDPGNMVSLVHVALKHQIGIKGGSTVSLIAEKDDCLLIDTGYEDESDESPVNKERNWNLLKALLAFNGIRPEDITKVFITHFHPDHFGGIDCFRGAKWFCHRLAFDDLKNPLRDRFIPLGDGDQVIPNAVVMSTPGHTRGHSSILWSNDNESLRAAICGDAIINLAWLQSGFIWKFNSDFYDREVAHVSIRHLIEGADLIIPGHGQPFFSSAIKLIK